jgi:hypothetical protein
MPMIPYCYSSRANFNWVLAMHFLRNDTNLSISNPISLALAQALQATRCVSTVQKADILVAYAYEGLGVEEFIEHESRRIPRYKSESNAVYSHMDQIASYTRSIKPGLSGALLFLVFRAGDSTRR